MILPKPEPAWLCRRRDEVHHAFISVSDGSEAKVARVIQVLTSRTELGLPCEVKLRVVRRSRMWVEGYLGLSQFELEGALVASRE